MRLLLAVALGLGIPAAASAQTAPAGFDAYRFGMSPQDVITLPNTSWGAPQTITFTRPESGVLAMVHVLRNQKPLVLEGQEYEVSVFFDPQRGLNEVQLARRLPDRAVAECEREFQASLKRLEMRYGVFYPSVPAFRSQEDWKVESPALPGGGSRYALITGAGQINAAGIRRYGPISVVLGMSTDGRSSCGLALQFVKKD